MSATHLNGAKLRRTSISKGFKDEGTSSKSNGEPKLGSLIWIKLNANSWWPAQIVDENTVSEVNKPDRRLPSDVLVRVYGSYQYLYVNPVKCLSEFETVLQQNNGSYHDIFQRALEQDVPTSKSGRSTGEGSKHKGATKGKTRASKDVTPNRKVARGNLKSEDTTVRQGALATPETKVTKHNGRTLDTDGTSNDVEIIGTSEFQQGSVSDRLKSRSRTASEKAKARISQQFQANLQINNHILDEDEKRTAKNDNGQKKRTVSRIKADEGLRDELSKQDQTLKPDSKKLKTSSAKKEGKSEVTKLAESMKKEKPVSPIRTGSKSTPRSRRT